MLRIYFVDLKQQCNVLFTDTVTARVQVVSITIVITGDAAVATAPPHTEGSTTILNMATIIGTPAVCSSNHNLVVTGVEMIGVITGMDCANVILD